MRIRRTAAIAAVGLVAAVAAPLATTNAAPPAKSNAKHQPLIARELDPELREVVPEQLTADEADVVAAAGDTTAAKCAGDTDETLILTIAGSDPENPLTQDVVFFNETISTSTGKATLWVAWDYLATDYGRQDLITCAQLDYLQGMMDDIVDTDVDYFGDYQTKELLDPETGEPTGEVSANIDVMIFNIVDESYFDEDFGSYIAGFYSSGFEDEFNRNMIFIDSYDWGNRIGPNDSEWRPGDGNDRPFLYEGTVAHELEHLIHNDYDQNEESWIDEGLADLAQLVNGFGHDDGHVVYYLAFNRTSLTQWGSQLEDYGAAYLFQVYLAEQFAGLTDEDGGLEPEWTQALVANTQTSIAGVEDTASTWTGSDVSFTDLFDSWILANYLDDTNRTGAGDWPLGYESIDLNPFIADGFSPWSIARSIKEIYGAGHKGALPTSRYYGGSQSGTVEYPVGALPPHTPLYSTFKGVAPELDAWLRGDGSSGVAPISGEYELASGGGHLMTDRWVELGNPQMSVEFDTWFNIEEDWDFAFVELETTPGTWVPLVGNITRHSEDPFGSTAWTNALGSATETDAAITGSSAAIPDGPAADENGWVHAEFTIPDELDAYRGNTARLNYYTDDAYNDEGMFIDNASIDGADADGFEDGQQPEGPNPWANTTGLFENSWVGAYVNPVYQRGKLAETQVGYLTETYVDAAGRQITQGTIDTSSLNRDEATIVFANRPGESPFDANYLFLPEKGNAKK